MIITKTTGLARFYYATRYSIKGLRAAYRSEPAFRYELWAAALLLPLAFWLAQSGLQLGLLISSLLFVLIMELINTAIEAVVDRAGTEFHALAGLAKDLGSAAVLLALFVTALIWGGIAWDNFS
ncbi:diacylglycerol kinase [Marinobacterium iners]|uniref:diacylglycerol kinase n=1 Tax=Marinobacterium iners TaxID=48076 RepID=UPI001A8FC574|nr:diacylglycerol kinase [Marinobacterium iners]QSR35535.1 diacylglycerol kinase [Marinobacterium iners]